ncbi:MAG: hypothetical protein N2447_03810 [Thermoanaerobaculum sp.]|nr:hypothetical protein [Thermoanaerobaculum sp.]
MKRWFFPMLLLLTIGHADAGFSIAGSKGAIFVLEPSPQLGLQLAQAEQTLALLAGRGWDVRELRVRFTSNPYDATQGSADVVLPSHLGVEEHVFLLVRGVVRRQLKDRELGGAWADLLAAHLAPPGSRLRRQWEESFQASLWAGDWQRTALLELFWRHYRDQGVRTIGSVEAAWRLLVKEKGEEKVVHALWEVILAALLEPSRLGFTVNPWPMTGSGELLGDTVVSLAAPQLRWLQLPREADGIGLSTNRLSAAAVRLLVLYQDGRWDALTPAAGEERRVPLWGVRAAFVGVLALAGEATASFSLRELHGYPVRLGAVEVVEEGDHWQAFWQVEEQQDVQSFVVEVWSFAGTTPVLVGRDLIPAAGNSPALVGWVGAGDRGPRQLRVYALTTEGVLARLFVSPVLGHLGEQEAQEAP